MSLVRKFRVGDTVLHRPTGETWALVKDEHDGWVTPGGWPPSQGRAEDCKLVESNPTKRLDYIAERIACSLYGYFKGDSTGSASAMKYFENYKDSGECRHIIERVRNELRALES